MKFRFFGDADCPDWILAEINSLSRLSSVKMKLLAQVVVQGLIDPPIKMEKAEKLFADSKLDSDIDLKACIACLAHIMLSAVRFSCDSSILQRELQQLGLPREHSTGIKKVTDESSERLATKLKDSSLRINELKTVSARLDEDTKCVVLEMDINNEKKFVTFTPFMLQSFLNDLKKVRKTMHELNEHSSAFG